MFCHIKKLSINFYFKQFFIFIFKVNFSCKRDTFNDFRSLFLFERWEAEQMASEQIAFELNLEIFILILLIIITIIIHIIIHVIIIITTTTSFLIRLHKLVKTDLTKRQLC